MATAAGGVMSVRITAKWDRSQLAWLEGGKLTAAVKRALRKAGATALRDMRSEASKRIRARKRISPKYISRALTLSRPRGADIATMEWALVVSGKPVPLIAYPHREKRGTKAGKRARGGMGPRAPKLAGGVIVEVNTGRPTLIRGAFVATMANGHKGIFRRLGKARLPIKELLGSRPVDALLHAGEADAVAARGGRSFGETFERVLPLELEKAKK
jgi:hypothetical protein